MADPSPTCRAAGPVASGKDRHGLPVPTFKNTLH